VKDPTKNTGESARNAGAEKQVAGKPSRENGQAGSNGGQGDPQPPKRKATGDRKTTGETTNGSAAGTEPAVGLEKPKGKSGKPKGLKPRKRHKRKGTSDDAPPASIGLSQVAYAALLAIEAANPEMTRKQVIENALKLLAGHIAYLPAIQLARLDSDTLIKLAGAAAKWEDAGKKTLRKITLAEYDEEERAEHARELEAEIKKYGESRLTLCRMAGIPIAHGLTTSLEIAIGGLMEKKQAQPQKAYQDAYDSAIQILTAYKPVPPDAPKPKPQENSAETNP